MPHLDPTQLLAEIEDVIRTAPSQSILHHVEPEALGWLGRAASLIRRWNTTKGILFDSEVRQLHAGRAFNPETAIAGIFTTLHEARHDLRLSAVGPLSIAVQHGAVFDYFDEVRKVIGSAQKELFFVDPYLDSEFASRYLAQVAPTIRIRLLGRKRLTSLLPAVELLSKQNSITIEVRSSPTLHDRFLFVDGRTGFHSGASFKDGAKTAPTTFTEITDTFQPVLATYEELWSSGGVPS
ncbi:MAG: hypothetical protein Q7U28_09915 [Aquabacterium sp.]|nr:hypothetical protein [Aquabacterium sp.]